MGNAPVIGREQQLAVALFKVASATHAAPTLGYVLRFLADLSQLCPTLVKEFAAADAAKVFGVDPVTVRAAPQNVTVGSAGSDCLGTRFSKAMQVGIVSNR